MTASQRLLGGRYEVGELLGYGGMAEVHRGRDLRLGRDVAIKMLRSDLARDTTFQMRFRREAQNAASLNHPAIAAIYDTGEERGPNGEPLPYIVMEFVNGRTLKEVLAAEGRLQPRRALEITADICAALEFSHRHGIIHRDVKPGNVMVTPSGQVKVMDFGIARDLGSGATTMTQTAAVIGTAQYLSPEQARGEAVDARSDVYATGCVLFELLCGHPPFVGDSAVSVAYQHVREDPRPPSEINPEVTPDIDAVVLKALAKNPANRYQSAAEMRADLLRAAAGRPVLATPVLREQETMLLGSADGAARVGDQRRRRASTWVMASLAVLGVLAVVALIVGLILASQRGEETVAVPDVVGETEERAEQLIREAGLVPERGDPVNSRECEVGTVVEQSPTAAEGPVEPGTTVTYRVCAGPAQVEVPTVVNLTQEQAERVLADAGLESEVRLVDHSADEGIVVDSDPKEGELVEEGSTVVLMVSRGNLVQVPDVTGQPLAVARGLLENSGFAVEAVPTSDEPGSPDEVGTVASQSVGPGELAARGSTITIYFYDERPDLQADVQVGTGGQVTVTWDNDIYGGVVIDWGDGTDEQAFDRAAGNAPHTYATPGQTYQITVRDPDHPDRSVTLTVEIAA
ncbi:MAG: Stk1 family PASTA domain-containing Ser/Thr kinase [Micromonosporaceae bacterium]|jgi:beta-lactam-binding protein with PASTA domain/predicted Ser/Thr protein kinase